MNGRLLTLAALTLAPLTPRAQPTQADLATAARVLAQLADAALREDRRAELVVMANAFRITAARLQDPTPVGPYRTFVDDVGARNANRLPTVALTYTGPPRVLGRQRGTEVGDWEHNPPIGNWENHDFDELFDLIEQGLTYREILAGRALLTPGVLEHGVRERLLRGDALLHPDVTLHPDFLPVAAPPGN